MTVLNKTNKTREAGNGVRTAFDFSFKIFNENDLDVFVVDSADNKTLQTS